MCLGPMSPCEKEHDDYLRENSAECMVLLKKDGHFPLKEPGKIALYGSGARNTIKGGTGSGEVNSHFFTNIEQALQEAGFTVTTEAWLDAYDRLRVKAKEQFISDIKAEAKARHTQAAMFAMGRSMPEPDYDLPLDGAGDTAIYVLSRISGEGSDRAPVHGEILLSATEKRDILACNEKYDNFMLVLNVGGVVDLTKVMKVKNILLLSQLGVETSSVLADCLLGRESPSGKLTTTWAAWKDYPSMIEFGDADDTCYKEGIYVGYRYFDSVGGKVLFPFGYGLSYSEFSLENAGVSLDGEQVTVKTLVKNIGGFAAKEVVQLYVSLPEGKLDQPYQMLAAFGKTGVLAPGEEEEVSLSFAMHEIAPYEEATGRYILEPGDYILRAGNSSRDTAVAGVIAVEEEICCLQAKNVLGKPDFEDYKPAEEEKRSSRISEEQRAEVTVLTLEKDAVVVGVPNYDPAEDIDEVVDRMSDDQLIKMNLGAFNPKSGVASMIGNAGFTVAGAAGQTSMEAAYYDIPSMVMADGPAGLRLSRQFVRSKDGVAHSLETSFPESILEVLPKAAVAAMKLMNYRPKKGEEVEYQYATAIPIGTALAQSFNVELAEKCGDMVGAEMEQFGVHLWLAPAQNIHRSIRCGRNFEYFSEDPLISGAMSAAITKGVQSHPGRGTTIKHYAANNQELNRTQNNSQVSERAMREIYLRGFGIAVRESQPKAVMTSYNLLNGTHTSENRGLIRDILRAEFGYQGIVMTDWVISGYAVGDSSKYPVAKAPNVIMAGGDLFMPGGKSDYDDVAKALKEGKVTRKQLKINASHTARMARELVK